MSKSDKGQQMLKDRAARIAIDCLSKAALQDLVVDLIRRCAGDEDLDGARFIAELEEAFEPVRCVRDDKPVPKVWRGIALPREKTIDEG